MKEDYTIKLSNKQIKIFINNVLYLAIKQDELVGIQSWIMGYDSDKKSIAYNLLQKRKL